MQIDFFGDTPDEVVDKLKNKIPTLTDDLDKIKGDAYKKAFTISGIAKTSLLADIQESMIKALEKGKGFDEWRSDLFDDLECKGWANKFETLNDDEVNILGDSARLKLIYDTNIRSAYAQASYESGIASGAKYIRYVAVLDHRTRQTHADMRGIIKPINDPWWNINYPPNGFNCRCSVMFLKDGDLKARGWEDKVNNATLPNIAENGFKKHSGKPYAFNTTAKRLQNQNLERIKANDEIITGNLGKDAPKLYDIISSEMENLQIRQTAKLTLETMYGDTDFSKGGYRANLKEPLVLTKLKDKTIKLLNSLDYPTNGEFKALENLLHGMRLKKIKDKNALSKDEFLNMPLNFIENNLYIGLDERNNKSFAFFWEIAGKKVNYAYFDINSDLKTYGKTNLQTMKKYKKVISGS